MVNLAIGSPKDSGNTWDEDTSVGIPQNWRGLAMSADGGKMVAVAQQGHIWTSTDGGDLWLQDTSVGTPQRWRLGGCFMNKLTRGWSRLHEMDLLSCLQKVFHGYFHRQMRPKCAEARKYLQLKWFEQTANSDVYGAW